MWIYKKGGTELINVLCRIFVKNYKDTKNPKVRLEYGIFAGIVGIICNIVLFLTKLTAGFLTSSLSIMADAINNLSDAGSSIVTLAGFKLASGGLGTSIWARKNRVYIRLYCINAHYCNGC